MKKFAVMFFAVMFVIGIEGCSAASVSIASFPDARLREALEKYDYTSPFGVLDDEEISWINELYIEDYNTASLRGIELLTALEKLHVSNSNYLKEINISSCPKLKELSFAGNCHVTKINVSNCPALTTFRCISNINWTDIQMSEVSVSNCPVLTFIDCSVSSYAKAAARNFTSLYAISTA